MRKLKLINNLSESENHYVFYEKCDNGVSLIQKLGDILKINPIQLHLYNNREQLDHNKFITDNLEYLFYEITELNSTDVIVKIKKNYFGLPKFIQIDKNAKIKDLKDSILILIPTENLSIFLFNENGEMLTDSNTIDSYNIKDKSKISIYIGENLSVNINICNPLIKLNEFRTTQIVGTVKLTLTESISDIKIQISEIMGIDSGNLFLFTDSSCLLNDKRLINYPIKNQCSIYGLNIKKNENIQIENVPFKKGKYANIFKGKFGLKAKEIAVIKFKLDRMNPDKMKVLKYEIITRIKLSCTLIDRFVRMFQMYEERNNFFIVTDFFQDSLKTRYNSPEFQRKDIIHYCSQISEGLGYMHDNFIIHRNLKCSSVLIDKQNNVKLCNFYLSKYLYNCTMNQFCKGVLGSKIDDSKRWLAPEILAGEPYGFKSDIWSFAATMIEMISKKEPYSGRNIHIAVQEIVNNRTIVYDKALASGFSEIIDKCLNPLQCNRPTCKEVKELLENVQQC